MKSDQLFDVMQKATAKAFDRAGSALGQEPDEDLRLYNQLTPASFPALIEQYGEEKVMKYIQTMEAKRVKRGKHG